ncbi:hypothetical protein G4B88_014312 [Cannabis sativa]|uniref:Uncharacterized protein n=1 Tax=Cannabis sativa TaxID=3483 RepID=A0A7J6I970_CANSA|nr:hypothetical protein G4B88_014312 [Cannabis sativa]
MIFLKLYGTELKSPLELSSMVFFNALWDSIISSIRVGVWLPRKFWIEKKGAVEFEINSNGDGVFNVTGIDSFVKEVKLAECGLSYAVVSIMGPQSSGLKLLKDDTAFRMQSALFALVVSDI